MNSQKQQAKALKLKILKSQIDGISKDLSEYTIFEKKKIEYEFKKTKKENV